MDIGVIGAGNIGSRLARMLSAAGHQVVIANSRGPDTLLDLAKEIGVTAVDVTAAPRRSEVVIISVPMKAIVQLPADLFKGARDDLIIVDTGNYYSMRDGRIEGLEKDDVETRWVAQQLGRPVLKAFNNISEYSLEHRGRPKGSPDRFALPVAGDSKRAKDVVIGLIEQIGFDGVDTGVLDESWRQQPGSAAYCTNLDASHLRSVMQGLTAEDRAKLKERRDLGLKTIMALPGGVERRGDTTPVWRSLAGFSN